MKIIVVLMAVVFMAGMAIWLFLFKNCYEMIQDIRSGTRKVPVIRKAVDKYDDCCKLEIAVNNTEVFVEKIIENLWTAHESMAADCGNGQICDCFTGNIFGGSF